MNAISRNQLCPCGSGIKYKRCCAKETNKNHVASRDGGLIELETGHLLSVPQAMEYAIKLHKAGGINKAQSIYQQILQRNPNSPDALHLCGLANHQLGKHDLAFNLITRAIAVNPRAAHFHNNLGEVCRIMNRPHDALACYAKALALQPDFPEVHRNIGLAHLACGNADLAVSLLHEALMHFPGYLGIYWALGLALMSQGKADKAIEIYDKGLAKCPTDSALLCAKGISLKATGNLPGCIQHYRYALDVQPHVPELHHNLAIIFHQQGNVEEAIACLKNELKLSPQAESARHLLAALQNTPTDRAPASYVRDTFDGYADNFDQHLVSTLRYRTPGLLADILRRAIGFPLPLLNILDLGCGTGLFGNEIKDLKKRLTGIDLAPRMLDKARQRQIYDELIVGDLLDYLDQGESGQFDLVAAADVFNYIGNLTPIFEHVLRMLAPGGWFIFSIEAAHPASGDYLLNQTGRYQHHQAYLARLTAQFGYMQINFSESCLREEKDQPVAGYLYLLQKPIIHSPHNQNTQ